jgi:group I intron endonuclease
MKFNYPGVYQWKNTITDKVYVGSSINIRRRKSEHILRLNKGCEGNEYFQRAWNKYGPSRFEFSLLEACSKSSRLIREQFWIDKLKATDESFGYNLVPTRASQLYGAALSKHQKKGWAKYTKEERKLLNLHLNDPVLKTQALAKSNEVKKLQPWRDAMERNAWSKLRDKWQDPVLREKIILSQRAGRFRKKRRQQRALLGIEV